MDKLFLILTFMNFNLLAEEFPEFSDYKVPSHSEKKVGDIGFDTSKMHWKIQEAIDGATGQTVNFAGNYYLFQFGCGTECIGFKMIDLDTGQLIDANIEPASWGGFCYHKDSSLLVANPYTATEYKEIKSRYQTNGMELPQTTAYYWNGKEFIQLAKTSQVYFDSCIRN